MIFFIFIYLASSVGDGNKTLNSNIGDLRGASLEQKGHPILPSSNLPIPFGTLDVGLVSQASDTASVVISSWLQVRRFPNLRKHKRHPVQHEESTSQLRLKNLELSMFQLVSRYQN